MTRGNKKPRPPEKSYVHVPLLDKLGVKPESRVAVVKISDAGFLVQLRERAKDVSLRCPRENSDLIFLAIESKADLEQLPELRPHLKSNGAIWAVYPKGVDYVREADVRGMALASGLVDIKVVSFSATHTALKLVIPLAQR
ncbi:MAG: hypothetical protein WAL55_07350 [Candidatus Acidiferrales bacterium]